MGRFPILQPPGNGISSSRKRFKRAGKRNIQTLIFFTRSVLRFLRLIAVVSRRSVFPVKSTVTPSDSMIDRNVRTSPIRGTLWSVKVSKKSPQAMSGSAAFFDHDIETIPDKSWGQLRESIWDSELKGIVYDCFD
jgi:hypothetical protein